MELQQSVNELKHREINTSGLVTRYNQMQESYGALCTDMKDLESEWTLKILESQKEQDTLISELEMIKVENLKVEED